MIQIRRNIFETNSSSTHAFAYHKKMNLNIDFENYEATITPFLNDEKINIPIHKFESVEDKLRYFYTQYRWYWKPDDENWYNYTTLHNFMEIIFELFPKVTFDLDKKYDHWKDLMYFEDADCIFDDYWNDPEDLSNQIKDIETMKKFFNEGIIYFGSRDYYYHNPWDEVWNYNNDIEKITSVTE